MTDIKKYPIHIEWSEEDQGYIATVPEFKNLSAFGETREKALEEGKVVLEGYVESISEDIMVLERVVKKALKNGWKFPEGEYTSWKIEIFEDRTIILRYFIDDMSCFLSIPEVIFSHAFAKAFWGKEEKFINLAGELEINNYVWQYYLQKMIIEEDPLLYLKDFLGGEDD